ncbi:hypothetical protein QJQ45_022773 [Haematococcus lacustris]|nr:hypothetical protein QJQ45_022773 [Haematococcus lacustris]
MGDWWRLGDKLMCQTTLPIPAYEEKRLAVQRNQCDGDRDAPLTSRPALAKSFPAWLKPQLSSADIFDRPAPGEAGGAHHVPTEHAPTIHAGTMQPCEAQPAKELTGMPYPCMLRDTRKEGGTIADKTYNTLVLCKDALHDMKQAYLQWKGMHEADPPARSRHREDANAKEDAATPPPPTRNEKPSTKTGPKKPRSKKGAKNTSHSKDRHTQTLMSRYLTNTQAATTATIPSPPVPCPTTKAPPILPTQPHQTPSRQHLTLTTLNVRGLYRARRDVSHLIHHHHPDILILTETKTHHKKDTPGWLKVTTQDYTLHRHGGHSEVLIGIKHDLAIQMQATLVPPSTEAEINSRCVILTLSQHHSDNLTIVATYWPSGCNEDALPLRENMQHHIRTATGHLPGSLILAGDLNATMKTEDRSEHTEYTQDRMMREFASEMRLSEADPGDRAWTYQQPHCNSRIDAILTRDARPGPEHRTIVDTHAYLSDHRPLIATLTTARMGIHLAQTQQAQSHKHTVLTTPITDSDREAFRLAVQQPSSGAPQLHAQLAAYLSPLFTEATDFLANLDKANPHPAQTPDAAGRPPPKASC